MRSARQQITTCHRPAIRSTRPKSKARKRQCHSDQRPFRQTVVLRYGGWMGRVRPLINLMRRPPLPCPGLPVPFFYVAFLSTDDKSAFATLFRRLYNDHCTGEYSHCVVGLHEQDPRAAVLRGYSQTPFAGRLFAVTMDGPPDLDGRIPYVEAALL
jgi:hypothetical protein